MTFQLHQAQYDHQRKQAYVESRRGDGDGGEQLVVAVFSFCTKERLSTSEGEVLGASLEGRFSTVSLRQRPVCHDDKTKQPLVVQPDMAGLPVKRDNIASPSHLSPSV
jgi:hypothetical protein